MDPQCNATVGLGLSKDLEPNIYDCLAGDATLTAAAKPTAVRDLDVVPATTGTDAGLVGAAAACRFAPAPAG
jgi:cellulose biosynthesis protein BcsQ